MSRYVIEAIRWNSHNLHSYIDSSYVFYKDAEKRAVEECYNRGGKYSFIIWEIKGTDKKEIYRAMSSVDLGKRKLLEGAIKSKRTIAEMVNDLNLFDIYLNKENTDV